MELITKGMENVLLKGTPEEAAKAYAQLPDEDKAIVLAFMQLAVRLYQKGKNNE